MFKQPALTFAMIAVATCATTVFAQRLPANAFVPYSVYDGGIVATSEGEEIVASWHRPMTGTFLVVDLGRTAILFKDVPAFGGGLASGSARVSGPGASRPMQAAGSNYELANGQTNHVSVRNAYQQGAAQFLVTGQFGRRRGRRHLITLSQNGTTLVVDGRQTFDITEGRREFVIEIDGSLRELR